MMNSKIKKLIASGFVLGMVLGLMNVFGSRVADACSLLHQGGMDELQSTVVAIDAKQDAPAPVSTPTPGVPPVLTTNIEVTTVADLDARRQFALGMIETGNNDREIGGAGEVSRYQIMPSVWKHYSQSSHYQNPSVSLKVAQSHWMHLYDRFKEQAHREPTDFDMYVLWNTRYGYYASKGFNPKRLSPVVRDRAQRFVNLVERADLQVASGERRS